MIARRGGGGAAAAVAAVAALPGVTAAVVSSRLQSCNSTSDDETSSTGPIGPAARLDWSRHWVNKVSDAALRALLLLCFALYVWRHVMVEIRSCSVLHLLAAFMIRYDCLIWRSARPGPAESARSATDSLVLLYTERLARSAMHVIGQCKSALSNALLLGVVLLRTCGFDSSK